MDGAPAVEPVSSSTTTVATLERLSTLLTLGFKLGIAFGGAVVFAYCAMIRYYPRDVALGDGVFLLASFIGFAVGYSALVFTLYGSALAANSVLRFPFSWMLALGYAWRRRRKLPTPHAQAPKIPPIDSNEAMYALGALLPGLLLLALAFDRGGRFGVAVVGTIVVMALLRGVFRVEFDRIARENRSPAQAKLRFAALIFALPLLFGVAATQMLYFPMELIGVRKSDVSVLVQTPYHQWISRTLDPAQPLSTEASAAFDHATVLFQSIGSETLLEIGGRRFPLPTSHVVISYAGSAQQNSTP
jgi:hypothetical protein